MALTEPDFIERDADKITAEMIAQYEAATGKTLYPGQIERLLIDLIAYRETLVRTAINDTGRQNLVAFSRAPMLDYLGELVGVRVDLPDALNRRREVGDDGEGAGLEVVGDVGDRHGHSPRL